MDCALRKRLQPAKLSTCERQRPKKFLSPKQQQQHDSGGSVCIPLWQPHLTFASMGYWFGRHEKCKGEGAMDSSPTFQRAAEAGEAGACLRGEEPRVQGWESKVLIAKVKQRYQSCQCH